MTVPRSRLLDLMKVQCRIFASTYNPEGIRMGNKILRQRLRGPALATYYPRRLVTFKELENAFPVGLMMDNDAEEDRLWKIDQLKARGKGTPKKKTGPPDLRPTKKK